MTTYSPRSLHIDIETYSSIPIKNGVYKYASAEDFEILLLAFCFDDDEVTVIDLAQGEAIPDEVLSALTDPSITKIAHNANFERTCLARYLTEPMPPEQWKCSMVYAYYCGLPGSLKEAGKALGIEAQKLETGTRLINYYCQPDQYGKRRDVWLDPASWDQFKAYCKRDVEAEKEIWHRLEEIASVPQREWKLWQLDQRINDTGIGVDSRLVESVRNVWEKHKESLLRYVSEEYSESLNIKSNPQLLEFIKDEWHIKLPDLKLSTLSEALSQNEGRPTLQELLMIRIELTRTALKKYDVFTEANVDDRIRGILQFYGAHTGRWSGRLVQPQNLPRPRYEDYDQIRELVLAEDLEGIQSKYGSVADALSSIIRTVIRSDDGLTVADYSAIEARVLAWLADEQWVLDAFAQRKDLYCETASQMFGVPVVKHGENGHLRSKGKIAVLACGYGGSVGALKAFGADRMGMSQSDMQETVDKWRLANANICKYWRKVEGAAKKALRLGGIHEVGHGVSFEKGNDCLKCNLPTGRSLIYYKAGINEEGIYYYEKTKKTTWGGRLVENITQAVARDCLASALLRLDAKGYRVVAHIHDEVIIEGRDLDGVCDIMGQSLPWAPGLELRAEGFVSDYYKKD